MNSNPIKRIVIAGGGTAGWVSAAALSKQLGQLLDITLVESDEIGTVGVGEASIPPMRAFHRIAGIDEQDFMRATSATFKLGIQFENWKKINENYIHSFGKAGISNWMAEFHHIWLHSLSTGSSDTLGKYCLELQAAKNNLFLISEESNLNYAYHLDATAYAAYLRKICEKRGVKRIEGKIREINQDPSSGFITKLHLESGAQVEGDFFIDCTGFKSLLIEKTLKTGFEDWSKWLPTDRAIAVQTHPAHAPLAYTRSIARTAGWQWQIPLQHRVGNGLVYCSSYLSDDEAHHQLLNNLDAQTITEPRLIRYITGRRKNSWNKNCLALGLSSGFLEPLESTSIHLIMIGITRFIQQFPFSGISASIVNFYNETSRKEFEAIRDFIVLHYKLTERNDTDFWIHCKNQEIPKSLEDRINMFYESGHIFPSEHDLFQINSWLQVMIGQGLEPKPGAYHYFAKLMTEDQLQKSLNNLKASIDRSLKIMVPHEAFIQQYCPADVSCDRTLATT